MDHGSQNVWWELELQLREWASARPLQNQRRATAPQIDFDVAPQTEAEALLQKENHNG